MIQNGVRQIPDEYILKRWCWDTDAALGDPKHDAEHEAPRQGMTEDARNMMILASMRKDFVKVAKVACLTDDGRCIVKTHMRAMKADLDVYRKREEKKAKEVAAQFSNMPTTSAPNATSQQSSNNRTNVQASNASGNNISNSNRKIRNPPRSNTKGRPQEIANKNPLDLATKKPRKCTFCGSTDHTIRKCEENLRQMGLIRENTV